MSDKLATAAAPSARACDMFDKELAVHMLRQQLKLVRWFAYSARASDSEIAGLILWCRLWGFGGLSYTQ